MMISLNQYLGKKVSFDAYILGVPIIACLALLFVNSMMEEKDLFSLSIALSHFSFYHFI